MILDPFYSQAVHITHSDHKVVPKVAEVGVPCMPATFVTYQTPLGADAGLPVAQGMPGHGIKLFMRQNGIIIVSDQLRYFY